MQTAALRVAAKARGVSISMLICSVIIYSILHTNATKNKVIRISVPVDTRRLFDLSTGRNGSLYILVSVKPKMVKSFEGLLEIVKEQFQKYLTKDHIRNLAYTNVKQASMPIFKILPIKMKKLFLKIGYTCFGENQFTTTITNLGEVKLDESIKPYIEDMYFTLGKEIGKPINMTVSSFDSVTKIVLTTGCDCGMFLQSIVEHLQTNEIAATVDDM